MNPVGQTELWSFLNDHERARKVENDQVRKSIGHRVTSYLDLARKVAELQFRNNDQVLLYRGQPKDHKDQAGNSTLKPPIFRPSRGTDHPPDADKIRKRYQRLEVAENSLSDRFRAEVERLGTTQISRHRLVRWSLLQHYKVCRTPLLDVTQSLRIAASFAALENDSDEAFLFVLGVPNVSGAITVSADVGLQIARLTSVCPPAALRPHLQEGYLLGEYPDMVGFDQKAHYSAEQIDFGLRLVGKFRFRPAEFRDNSEFPMVTETALYPEESRDPLALLAKKIHAHVWSQRYS